MKPERDRRSAFGEEEPGRVTGRQLASRDEGRQFVKVLTAVWEDRPDSIEAACAEERENGGGGGDMVRILCESPHTVTGIRIRQAR